MYNTKVPKLFIGGLTVDTTQKDLHDYFSRYGKIKNIKLIRDKATNQSKCFAFLRFASRKSVNKFVDANDDPVIKGKRVDCQIARAKTEKNDYEKEMRAKKVFVGKLLSDTTDHDLHQHFSQFGSLETAYTINDYSNEECKGFGFVIFQDSKIADKVIKMKDHTLNGTNVVCSRFSRKQRDEGVDNGSNKRKTPKKSNSKKSQTHYKLNESSCSFQKNSIKQSQKLKHEKRGITELTTQSPTSSEKDVSKVQKPQLFEVPTSVIMINGVEFSRIPTYNEPNQEYETKFKPLSSKEFKNMDNELIKNYISENDSNIKFNFSKWEDSSDLHFLVEKMKPEQTISKIRISNDQ